MSAAQLSANIANAQLSTGPRTEEGKQRSSQNAVRHAIFAKTIPTRDRQGYQRLLEQYQHDLHPKGPIEEQFVQTVADAQWRLARCRELQASLLFADTETPDAQLDALNKYSLYEQRLTRLIQSNLKYLEVIQSARWRCDQNQLRDAAQIAKCCAANGTGYDPAADGFVFSAAELTEWMRITDRLENARLENVGRQTFGTPGKVACW